MSLPAVPLPTLLGSACLLPRVFFSGRVCVLVGSTLSIGLVAWPFLLPPALLPASALVMGPSFFFSSPFLAGSSFVLACTTSSSSSSSLERMSKRLLLVLALCCVAGAWLCPAAPCFMPAFWPLACLLAGLGLSLPRVGGGGEEAGRGLRGCTADLAAAGLGAAG